MVGSDRLNPARTGLADLVRLWAQALRQLPGCDAPPAGWLQALDVPGFDASPPAYTLRLPPQLPEQDEDAAAALQRPPDIAAPTDDVMPTKLPRLQALCLKAPILAVVAADFEPESECIAAAGRLQAIPPLMPQDYIALQPLAVEPWRLLAPRSRWWPVLRQFTLRVLAGPDLPQLVGQCARGRLPRRLPRLQRRGKFRRLLVLRDTRKCMCPYLRDFDALIAQLEAQPQAGTLIVQSFHGLPPHVPLGVDAVLVLSDLGLCATVNPAATANAWAAWARALTARGVMAQAWVPVSTQWLPSSLARDLPCVPWHERSRFRISRGCVHVGQSCAKQQTAWMAQLWPLLAIAQRIEPALLRRARWLAGGQAQPEWEATLWDASYEHLAGEEVIQLNPARVAAWRRAFATLPAVMQLQVWQMFTAQHAHLPRSTLIVERLIWAASAKPEAVTEVQDKLKEAEDWLHRMAAQEASHSARHAQAVEAGENLALHSAFLHGLMLRNGADPAFTRSYAEDYTLLALAVGRMGQGAGMLAEVWARALSPTWSALDQEVYSLQLLYRPEGAFIEKCTNRPVPNELVSPQAPRLIPLLPQAARHSAIWQVRGQAPQFLLAQQQASPGDLHFRDAQGRHRLELGTLRRADWQHALGCDCYGVFCAVHVKDMRLRFRYLPPGTYLQGSPEGIGYDDEQPQHPVTLSQGQWLAEKLCTQALWKAVMGKNPSHFQQGTEALRCPVENVSWDDVQTFLNALHALLPSGCEAVLPTESQWEYACRTGTQTEYWWGDAPDGARANWDEQKKGTTPVDLYPPNPWGLYDMHGNVWEWCADGRRDYADSAERDPEGPGDDDYRMVRGGAWITLPGDARAASRGRRSRRDAYLNQGFRFALRSLRGPEAQRDADDASTPE